MQCGRLAFPPNPHGCEACGAAGALVAEEMLAGRGRLLAFVTTHHANQRDIPVPYTVASIALESGPVIRALMSKPLGDGLGVNDPVEAVVVEGAPGNPGGAAELRFRPVEVS